VGSYRGVPDISMSAACTGAVNVYQGFRGQPAGWYALCGTSEATPMFAGVVALAGHQPGLVSVRSGNNSVSFRQGGRSHTVPGFGARPGYNLAAGLGTVNAQYFVPELARLAGR
jgi:kumamolisin